MILKNGDPVSLCTSALFPREDDDEATLLRQTWIGVIRLPEAAGPRLSVLKACDMANHVTPAEVQEKQSLRPA